LSQDADGSCFLLPRWWLYALSYYDLTTEAELDDRHFQALVSSVGTRAAVDIFGPDEGGGSQTAVVTESPLLSLSSVVLSPQRRGVGGRTKTGLGEPLMK
jgi:hypothetical protein